MRKIVACVLLFTFLMPLSGCITLGDALDVYREAKNWYQNEGGKEVLKDTAGAVNDSLKDQPSSSEIRDKATVAKAQKALNEKGFTCGKVDGYLGPVTRKAIMNFQKSCSIDPADGRLDEKTCQALGI